MAWRAGALGERLSHVLKVLERSRGTLPATVLKTMRHILLRTNPQQTKRLRRSAWPITAAVALSEARLRLKRWQRVLARRQCQAGRRLGWRAWALRARV